MTISKPAPNDFLTSLLRKREFTFDVYPMKPGKTANEHIWTAKEHARLMKALRDKVKNGLFVKFGVEFTNSNVNHLNDDSGNNAIGVCNMIMPNPKGGVLISVTFFQDMSKYGILEADLEKGLYCLGTAVMGRLTEGGIVELDKVTSLTLGLRCGYDNSTFNVDHRDALLEIGKAYERLHPNKEELQEELKACKETWEKLDKRVEENITRKKTPKLFTEGGWE